jgi:DNA-binding transcriptional ArsR family regulator
MGKRKKHPGGFVIVYESEFRAAALLLREHGANAICLWNILMTKVEIGTGDIVLNAVEISELMKTSKPRISATLKILVSVGLISQVRKEGRHIVYKINPSVMWKGRETERQELLKMIQGGKK